MNPSSISITDDFPKPPPARFDEAPPPVPAADSSYSSFGLSIPSTEIPLMSQLEDFKVPKLYRCSEPGIAFVSDQQPGRGDYRCELKRLNLTLLMLFEDLLRLLSEDPRSELKLEVVETIRVVEINAMHLLNCLRIHQAFENIRNLGREQLESLRDLRDEGWRTCEQIAEQVNGAIEKAKSAAATTESGSEGEQVEDEDEFDRRLGSLHEQLGQE